MIEGPILTVFTPGRGSEDIVLERFPFVIGREHDCDLVLDLPWISRKQLVLELGEGGVLGRPEGRAELSLNGEPWSEARALAAGDRIEAGSVTLVFDAARLHAVSLDERAPTGPTRSMPAKAVLDEAGTPDRHLVVLGRLGAALHGAEGEELSARIAADALLELAKGRQAALVMLEPPGTSKAQILGARGAPLTSVNRTLLGECVEQQATVSFSDEAEGPMLFAPVPGPKKAALLVGRAPGQPGFSEVDQLFATILGQLLGPALELARRRAREGLERERLRAEREHLRRDIERRGRFGALIGRSAPMQRLAESIAKVAPTEATVLIAGETGAGKELVAREIHLRSSRAEGSFFALNCAALPENLIESELFGHRKGAFTGADRDRKGIFELAEGGTVFLDEVAELPLAAQAKVLRALDVREVLPLAAARPVAINVRLVAATHKDLGKEVSSGKFRQDLYYRLAVFPLAIPALRDRSDDIPPLVEHFLEHSAEAKQKGITRMSPRAVEALRRCAFPGNVRELSHLVQRAVILAEPGESLDLQHLPDELAPPPSVEGVPGGFVVPEQIGSLRDVLAAFERAVLIRELERDGWNRTHTAERLDVSLRAFMDKLRRFEIKGPLPKRKDRGD
ncbi:MAG: sigma 54-interacting transcriptional regulator [Myxococcota bacterium]